MQALVTMRSCCLIVVALINIGWSTRDFSWFKSTPFHDDNIAEIEGNWSECVGWSDVYNYIGAGVEDKWISLDVFGTETKINIGTVPWKFNFTALCITVQVPKNWDNEISNETIDYTLARIYSRDDINNDAGNGAFWMIPGGPGEPAASLYGYSIPWQTFVNGSYDVYIPDHRGVGFSARFECPKTLNISQCSDYTSSIYGDNAYFSTYQAVFDLAYTLDLFSQEFTAYNASNQIMYGVSYGTYYVNKYLQIYPNQVRAVILDGLCAGDQCKLSPTYDAGTQKTAIDFFTRCGQDSFCNAQFVPEYGDTIIEAIDYIYNLFDKNNGYMPCNPYGTNPDAQISKNDFQAILFHQFFIYEHRRMMIPPLLKRIVRCNSDDLAAITNWFLLLLENNQKMQQEQAAATTRNVLQANLALSEAWYGDDPTKPGPNMTALLKMQENYYINAGIATFYRPWWEQWDKYTPPSDLYDKYANPEIPLLLINGELDPQTGVEWARDAATNFGASVNEKTTINPKNRYYYEFSNSPHISFYASSIVNYTDDTIEYERDFESCGMYIVKSFIDDPYSVPDSRCLEWIIPLDWDTNTNISKNISYTIFGTTNAWGYDLTTVQPTKYPSTKPTDMDSDSAYVNNIVFASTISIIFLFILQG